MAIFGNGTGMSFSICAANYNYNTYEATNLNYFSAVISASTSGTGISAGALYLQFNGSSTAFPLTAIAATGGIIIRPTYASVRFNQDNGCLETFNPTTETWSTGKNTAGR